VALTLLNADFKKFHQHAKSSLSLSVTKYWKSASIWQSYKQKYIGTFSPLYGHCVWNKVPIYLHVYHHTENSEYK